MNIPGGKLVLQLPGGAEQEFELGKEIISVGRSTTNDIVVQDPKVSRQHARIEFLGGVPTIFDLGSANGVLLNGTRVQEAAMQAGDVLSFGSCQLRYEESAVADDADVTFIDSLGELEATLTSETMTQAVNDTHHDRLVVITPEKIEEISLLDDAITIGRHSSNRIGLDGERVSRQHARIERRGDRFFLNDLGSSNGTWVGRNRVDEWELRDGDTIRIGMAQLIFKAGFTEEALTLTDDLTLGKQNGRKPVIFLPGLMGSELWLGSEKVWPNVRALFKNPEIFHFSEDSRLEARGLVNEVVIVPNLIKLEQYGRMGLYLVEELGYERGKDYFEFCYDWRRDIRDSARKLAQTVEEWGIDRPVTIIAHSLGTLVSRYYVERLGGKDKVERLILMGGPHHGAPKALTSLVLGPKILPFGLLGQRLTGVVASFPSSYQILPNYPCITDQDGRKLNPMEDDSWLPENLRPMLHDARLFRKELGLRASVPTLSVFGYGLKTIQDMTVHRERDGSWSKLEFNLGQVGDATVPQSSAVLDGSDLHPVRQYHSALFVDNDVKMRLRLLLTNEF